MAASLLFSVFGFFYDLMSLGTTPYAVVLVLAILSGVNCALWILVIYKSPRKFLAGLIVGLIVLQFFNGTLMTWLARWMTRTFGLHEVATKAGVRFAAAGIVAVVMASYFFFIGFIRAEGKESYRIRSELELAHGIQKTLVPPVALRTERFEVYGISEPSDKVGGDLVDALLLPNGDMVAYVADIAGHGLPAGILMGMLKTAARTALLDAAAGHPSVTLPLLLEKLNRVLPDVKEPQMYATLTAFRLNADGRAWYAMAASPPVLHWSAQRRDWRTVEEEQFPLGLLPVSGFTGDAIELASGRSAGGGDGRGAGGLRPAGAGIWDRARREGDCGGCARGAAGTGGNDSGDGAGVWEAGGRSDAVVDPARLDAPDQRRAVSEKCLA